jgi:hypothetical protein
MRRWSDREIGIAVELSADGDSHLDIALPLSRDRKSVKRLLEEVTRERDLDGRQAHAARARLSREEVRRMPRANYDAMVGRHFVCIQEQV